MKKLLITIPCYNEEQVLEKTVEAVYAYAAAHLGNFSWLILILDNNSTDKTAGIAESLKHSHPEAILTDAVLTPGRGAALRESWRRFPNFDVYAYMDADLSTDLKDFSLLVGRAAEGYDFVTGSRYLRESDVKRNPKREFLSRVYNLLLRLVLKVSFRDAQCGFKAFSRRLVENLVPEATDNGWFWDTELMIMSCRRGYRVLEIPVSWREIRDELRRSKVSVSAEVIRNLKNIYYMWRRLRIESVLNQIP